MQDEKNEIELLRAAIQQEEIRDAVILILEANGLLP
jgi:hypothetical protein